MGIGGKALRIGAVGVIVALAGLGIWVKANEPGEGKFCTLALGMVKVDGRWVALQDGGQPGDDGCDSQKTHRDMPTLGLDCKVRAPDGEVVKEMVPNRADGLCGRPEADETTPVPWPEAS